MSRWLRWLIIISLGLRLVNLPFERFWYDEAFTAWIATLPLPHMMAAIRGDVHPPLWYLIEWLAVRPFGPTEWALRLPAAFISTAGTAELYRLVEKLGSKRAAGYAGALYAVLPGFIYYGQEARMYALLTWLVLAACRALLDRNWLRLALTGALTLYTQNLGGLYVALLLFAALFIDRRQAWKTGLKILLAYLPWLPSFIHQVSNVGGSFWIPPAGNAGGALYYLYFTTFRSVPEFAIPSVMAASVGITLVTVWALRTQLKGWLIPLMLAFLPALMLYLISLLWRPMMLDRALLPAAALLVGLWGAGLAQMPRPGRMACGVVLASCLALSSGYYYQRSFHGGRADLAFVDLIRHEYQTGDMVYHTNVASLIAGGHYLPEMDQAVLPGTGDLAQNLTDDTKEAMGIDVLERPMTDVEALGYCRVWLLDIDTPIVSDQERQNVEILRQQYPPAHVYPMTHDKMVDFDVVLLEMPSCR